MPKEAFSRAVIDQQLKDVGWNILDQSQVVFEDHGIAGRADYVLKDKHGKPVALIEAKSPEIDPYSAKQQALDYAETQYKGQIDYIYLANDHMIYFWDFITGGDAYPVPTFFSQGDLDRKRKTRQAAYCEPLTQKAVDKDYFQNIDPNIKIRPYQLEAYNAIATQYDEGKRSFLLEMATGTGKTILASLIISKFIRTQQAQTILFVVDRVELAGQTKGVFEKMLGNLSAVATYWGGSKKNLTGANVVVATIQSLIAHGKETFTPGYFDLVIHDEAHRSIYSLEARAVMDHFVGATKIGLTATPKDFLKNIDLDKLNEKDPRKAEARIQRDTYKYFECPKGEATYRYTIQDGVRDKYLVPPRLHKMTSFFTQQALTEQGLIIEGDFENQSFKINQIEKKLFLPGRNKLMMQEFLQYAEKTPENQIGKTLVFAVNQQHAMELAKILNALKPEFNGRFATVITSWVKDAHNLARDFKNSDKSLPRIAVSVDMLTTGYDAPEVQSIVLARPVFEPTLYQQIKGRGTRLCPEIKKDHFTIFDFCGVCEFFEEKYDWTAPLPDPRLLKGKPILSTAVLTEQEQEEATTESNLSELKKVINDADFVEERDQIVVGPDGDKVDREMYQDQWLKTVKEFAKEKPEIEKIAEDESKNDQFIQILNTEILNKPQYYFNEENLSKSYKVAVTIKDFFLSALGKKKLPTPDQQLDEWKTGMLQKYGENDKAGSQKRYLMAKLIADQAIKNEELRQKIQDNDRISLGYLGEPPFNMGFTAEEWINTFSRETLIEMTEDIKKSKILRV